MINTYSGPSMATVHASRHLASLNKQIADTDYYIGQYRSELASSSITAHERAVLVKSVESMSRLRGELVQERKTARAAFVTYAGIGPLAKSILDDAEDDLI